MSDHSQEGLKEIELKGIGVSPGVVVGPVLLVTTEDERLVERTISEEDIPREITRFEEALIATRHQVREIQQKVSSAIGQESASIFDAHLLVVDDRSFVEEVIRGLSAQHRNVEAVLKSVADRYAQALSAIEDDYLRERAADVRDVTRRILRNLSGRSSAFLAQLDKAYIVVSNDLAPSDTATLNKDKVKGFATDLGSPTSHTAIMARALAIPAVVGLHDVSVRVSTGDTVLIDGNKGLFVIHPTRERLEHYGKVQEIRQSLETKLKDLRDQPAVTKDGYQVTLSANIELPNDVDALIENGAVGVGLFRTEYLYLSMKQQIPSEDDQYNAYVDVARGVGNAPAIIRTLDLGGDKFLSHLKIPAELNPFMGWRAIRFCLAQPDIFKTQLRAILRASTYENIKLMYPMVSNVDEVLRANAFLEEAKDELRQRGQPFNEDLEVGVMIEVPSAAITANLIAPHVDFFSLGTNDLVQYTLAVDRVNERVAYLYEPTHPAIIRLIKTTIDVGHEHGIWVGICGEMAANPLMAPLLMGLGIDEFSMSPSAVPLVKAAIRSVRFHEAEELAKLVLASESALKVLQLCRQLIEKVSPEILELVG
jgi:phosphoenolpyruvate-protein phosphotransferase (PTS system enzyme I)